MCEQQKEESRKKRWNVWLKGRKIRGKHDKTVDDDGSMCQSSMYVWEVLDGCYLNAHTHDVIHDGKMSKRIVRKEVSRRTVYARQCWKSTKVCDTIRMLFRLLLCWLRRKHPGTPSDDA